jgi:hypothetical protein
VRRLLAATAALAAACTDPRVAELAGELTRLQESRTPRASFERMQAEAGAAEASLAGLEAERDALGSSVEAAGAAVAAAEAALASEVARNGALNGAIQGGQQRLQQLAERQAALEQRIASERGRAQAVRDQAHVLARELRAGDPGWARRLRVQTLGEFLREVGRSWPGDAVLAELARRPLPADDREAALAGAERAAQVRDRVSEVYELGEGGPASAGAALHATEPEGS